ncbi:NmrA family NAD(P)-binding protein, partial [Campylobacter coli]
MSGTVAVTGATGFIGRHIVRELLAQGFSVRALTRQADKAAADNLQWIP